MNLVISCVMAGFMQIIAIINHTQLFKKINSILKPPPKKQQTKTNSDMSGAAPMAN